jgi:hypothetical protein
MGRTPDKFEILKAVEAVQMEKRHSEETRAMTRFDWIL